jgi:hypothetical protein
MVVPCADGFQLVGYLHIALKNACRLNIEARVSELPESGLYGRSRLIFEPTHALMWPAGLIW